MDGQTSRFFFNHQPLDIIHDANFCRGILAIWLSKDTSRPSLRAQLLGENHAIVNTTYRSKVIVRPKTIRSAIELLIGGSDGL